MPYIQWFSELDINDVGKVGGKNASLGEMYQGLTARGVKVPDGFATTAEAYWLYINENKLGDEIFTALDALDINDIQRLKTTGDKIRQCILDACMPDRLRDEISAAYQQMETKYGKQLDVAVRSSATAEDLPTASFAGQQETYLNIRGIDALLLTCQRVFASLFTDRAIAYRVHQGFAHRDVALSIGIQQMVRSDKAASGVMFTIDTESGFEYAVLITAAYGLGENVVQGAVNPDEFYVHKPTLLKNFRPILKRQLGEKAIKMIYVDDPNAAKTTRNVEVEPGLREQFSINDDEVLTLARYAIAIEQHYSDKAGHPQAMDIEWAKDGISGELYIVQARPETVVSSRKPNVQIQYLLKQHGELLLSGKSVGQKIGHGKARVILDAANMNDLLEGEILVTDITDPDWEPVMKRAAAIITNRGGRTCHAAIIARELGIPAVVGCGNATERLASGQELTVSCAEGDSGHIYSGLLEYDIQENPLKLDTQTRTHRMLNLGNPEKAFEHSMLPCDGVGLARLEFIINTSIGIHPNAILQPDKISSEERNEMARHCAGYSDFRQFYINRLAEGIGTIAAAFYPRPVIVRLSDFKSNEYASLLGGKHFEAQEENPMIGFRGAGRYAADNFSEAFTLECLALKQVRETMGLDNVALMIPFVRTLDEARQTLEILAAHDLKREPDGLKIYLMCEIPANAILADEFLQYFDGFSIGSNDLTQLTLGVDRDSGIVKGFDERNEAVLRLMSLAIQACQRQKKYVGICGQAPSDYPEITRWLVKQGIDSISLNPDSLLSMTTMIVESEANR